MFVILSKSGYLTRHNTWVAAPSKAKLFPPFLAMAVLRNLLTLGVSSTAVKVDTTITWGPQRNRPRRAQRGVALILELLVMTVVLLTLAAMAVPNIAQIRAGANQTEARSRVMRAFSAEAAITICTNTPGCTPSPALSSLIPQPGTVQASGYTYTFSGTPGAWTYTASPIRPGFSGHESYSASPTGYCTTPQGGNPICLQ